MWITAKRGNCLLKNCQVFVSIEMGIVDDMAKLEEVTKCVYEEVYRSGQNGRSKTGGESNCI